MEIEFVSYDGSYPNLCSGELVLKINGRKRTFGVNYGKYNWKDCEEIAKKHYNSFWRSGGCIKSTDDYSNMWAESGPWKLSSIDDLPKYLQPYADELIEIFNANVPWGCCGGCI